MNTARRLPLLCTQNRAIFVKKAVLAHIKLFSGSCTGHVSAAVLVSMATMSLGFW
jgi:hypothetical protein